jgi:hypothetical protein
VVPAASTAAMPAASAASRNARRNASASLTPQCDARWVRRPASSSLSLVSFTTGNSFPGGLPRGFPVRFPMRPS